MKSMGNKFQPISTKNSRKFHLIPIDSVRIQYFRYCHSISHSLKPWNYDFRPFSTKDSGKFRLIQVDSNWNRNFRDQQSIRHSRKPWNAGFEYGQRVSNWVSNEKLQIWSDTVLLISTCLNIKNFDNFFLHGDQWSL